MSDVTGTEDAELPEDEGEDTPRQRNSRQRNRQLDRLSKRVGSPLRELVSKSGGAITNGSPEVEDVVQAIEKLNPRNGEAQQKAAGVLKALALEHVKNTDPEVYEDLDDSLKSFGEAEDLAPGTWLVMRGSQKPHVVFESSVLGDTLQWVARQKNNGDWEYEELRVARIRAVLTETPEHGEFPEGMGL